MVLARSFYQATKTVKELKLAGVIIGAAVLIFAFNAFIVTGINVGWRSVTVDLIYGGIPALEAAGLGIVLWRRAGLHAVLATIWCCNLVNALLALFGAFGLY
jgi:hypothetical protein